MNKKILLGVIILLLLIAGSAAAYILLNRHSDNKADSHTETVSISGLNSTPTPLSDVTKEMVKNYVTSTLIAKHGEGKYTAIIREDSYKRTVTPQGGIITTLLVDVTETKETYMFTRTGTDTSQYGTSYLRCALESDQQVHPSVCKELAND